MVSSHFNHLNRPGRGALVRRGEFWYPARVIQREGLKYWRVRWWRECQFAEDGIEPGSLASVSIDDIVDSLWLKRAERRKIRVSNTNKFRSIAGTHQDNPAGKMDTPT
jgi:hypothetical protein